MPARVVRMADWIASVGGPIRGDIRVPGDKSVSHRAIMLAAIADPAGEGSRAFTKIYAEEARAAADAADARDLDLDSDQTLYAVHSADGERLAVMLDRDTAFAAAVAHELAPVSVH